MGVVVITERQGPNAMQILWQDDDGVDIEGLIVVLRLPESGTQMADMPDQLIFASTLGKIHGKEMLCAG